MNDAAHYGSTARQDALDLEVAARDAWSSEYVAGRKWTLWMRLSWKSSVSETVASEHVDEWARRLVTRIHGAAVFVGVHSDTSRRHAHALLYVPRGNAPPNPPPCLWLPGVAKEWHEHLWPHGSVWLARYSLARSTRPDGRHGAAIYAARDSGNVSRFGLAPLDPKEGKRRN